MDDKNQNQNQAHIDHELTKAVEKLGDAFRLIKDVFSDNQKRYESLAHEIRRDQEKEVKRQRRDAWLIAMISIVGIGSSVIAASYWSYEEEKVSLQKTQIAALYSEAHSIQRKIEDELSRRDKLMDAMIDVRVSRDVAQKHCTIDPAYNQQRLFESAFSLAGASYKSTGIFNSTIRNKIWQFESMIDIDKVPVCAKNAAKDNQLVQVQTEINNLILTSIEVLRDKKENIYNQIAKFTEKK